MLIFEGFKRFDDLIKLEVSLQKNNKDYLYKSINNVKFIVTNDNIDHPIQTFNHSQIEKIALKYIMKIPKLISFKLAQKIIIREKKKLFQESKIN